MSAAPEPAPAPPPNEPENARPLVQGQKLNRLEVFANVWPHVIALLRGDDDPRSVRAAAALDMWFRDGIALDHDHKGFREYEYRIKYKENIYLLDCFFLSEFRRKSNKYFSARKSAAEIKKLLERRTRATSPPLHDHERVADDILLFNSKYPGALHKTGKAACSRTFESAIAEVRKCPPSRLRTLRP